MMTISKVIQYHCHQCDYAAKHKDNLSNHIKSRHKGIRYPCNQCDFKATTKGVLKTHSEAIHEGVRY